MEKVNASTDALDSSPHGEVSKPGFTLAEPRAASASATAPSDDQTYLA